MIEKPRGKYHFGSANKKQQIKTENRYCQVFARKNSSGNCRMSLI